MTYSECKSYVKTTYPTLGEMDIKYLFESCETVYLNYTAPFNKSAIFDIEDTRATNWVTRAVFRILEQGEIDVKSYSENGLSIKVDMSLINELIGMAGVPND